MVVSPVGIGTKNNCAGEDQRYLPDWLTSSWVHQFLSPVEWGMITSGQTPPLYEKEAPIKKRKSLGKNKNVIMSPDGARNQELLCWRGPAAIYWTGQRR
jgi:hypothetical protein